MEAWSPYASMFDNPIRYSDQLGDEPGDDPPGYRKVIASVLGTINGLERGMGFRGVDAGRYPFTDTETQIYNGASMVGQIGIVLFSRRPGEGPATEPMPMPVGVKFQVIPATAKVPAGTLVLPLPPSQAKREANTPKKKDYGKAGGAEHKKNARPSTLGKHQKGQARKQQNRQGTAGQKRPPRKKPADWKGPWPPKKKNIDNNNF